MNLSIKKESFKLDTKLNKNETIKLTTNAAIKSILVPWNNKQKKLEAMAPKKAWVKLEYI